MTFDCLPTACGFCAVWPVHSLPFGFMRRFATDMERLFDEFEGFRFPSLYGREFFPFTREFEYVGWVPEIEVLRKNGDFIVRADLPGMKKENVEVEINENVLTLSGERKTETEEKHEGYFRGSRELMLSALVINDSARARKDGLAHENLISNRWLSLQRRGDCRSRCAIMA